MRKLLSKCAPIIMIAIVAFLLCFCGFQSTATDDTPTESPATLATEATNPPTEHGIEMATEPPEQINVYIDAIEDYMLPIEENSWEREHAPEIVMLHFSSCIVNHPEDPYNIQFIRDTFTEYGVSTHYIVERDGTIRCYIPENRVAWHAGSGKFGELDKYTNKMNYYAIGIEIVAIGSENDMRGFMNSETYQQIDSSLIGYTQEQYASLRALIADICTRYGIPMDRDHIIGHEEYSEHKPDPGELFDWGMIIDRATD